VSVEIRPATLEDARELAEVHLEGWRWGYLDILPADYLAGLDLDEWEAQWVGNFTASWADDMTALIAEENGRGVGLIACGTAGPMFGPPPERAGEVFAIYLREDAQGTGVGRTLFEAGTHALKDRGFDQAVLWVYEANDRARRFYEMAGWRADGAVGTHEVDGADFPVVRYSIDL
jgi:GNAT superfamily N-acetyltransferase